MTDIYMINGARMDFTEFGGSFANVDASDLGKATAVEALKHSKVEAEKVDQVIYGNVINLCIRGQQGIAMVIENV